MVIGIDASGVRKGGSFVYLKNLLESFNPDRFPEIDKIRVWGINDVLNKINKKPNMVFIPVKLIQSFNPIYLLYWKLIFTFRIAPDNCDLVFVPSALFIRSRTKVVVLLHNLLPFDNLNRDKYKYSLFYFKLKILQKFLSYSFRKADGVIFPSKQAEITIEESVGASRANSLVIYHSLGKNFYDFKKNVSKSQTTSDSLKLLCVSSITNYKGQFELLKDFLRHSVQAQNLTITFIGPISAHIRHTFLECLDEVNKTSIKAFYKGEVEYDEMPSIYHSHDALVFCSTCEAFGYPVIEGAFFNKPVVIRNQKLVEILEHYGYKNYFLYKESITEILPELKKSSQSSNPVAEYSNSDDTFNFLLRTYKMRQTA